MSDLARFFREAAGLHLGRITAVDPDDSALGQRLALACAIGRAAHPTLALSDEAFVDHLGRCLSRSEERLPPLEDLMLADLYLAAACLRAVEGSPAAFDAHCGPSIRAALARLCQSVVERDEIEQQLRVRLMIGTEEAPPRLRSYLGTGPLARWAAVAAQRLAVSALRSEETEANARERSAVEAAIDWKDPAVLLLKERYRDDFQRALEDAMGVISDRDRLLLRMHLINGLSTRSLAKMYNVDHSTVARWLHDARETISAEIQRLLCERLKMTTTEVKSLARLMTSQLDLSISRFLQSGETGGPRGPASA